MAGAQIRVASGNFVTARPIGVLDGIDYCFTGKVRRVDTEAINQQLEQHNVVLISPIGYSPSGEVFNLSAEEVATEVAIALQAEKLILLTEENCQTAEGELIAQLTTDQAADLLTHADKLPVALSLSLKAAMESCQQGVERAHLVNRLVDGSLLLELFSRDGIGTLISRNAFENIRAATLEDIGGIMELIKPLETEGVLVKRSREKLEMEINDYIIIERDGLIIGCTALHTVTPGESGEIACLAIHKDYRRAARGANLLTYLCEQAEQKGLKQLYVRSTQTMHWFVEKGFNFCTVDELPEQLQLAYNRQRNSKVLFKVL